MCRFVLRCAHRSIASQVCLNTPPTGWQTTRNSAANCPPTMVWAIPTLRPGDSMTSADPTTATPGRGGSSTPPRGGFGIDVGGSGIKGGIVDLDTGQLIGDRVKLPTPRPATPSAVAKTIAAVVNEVGWSGPLGVTYPGVVTHGIVRTAANVDKSWIGTNASDIISAELNGQEVVVLNDADAAGLAEEHYGAGKDTTGVVVLLTFGPGIGSAVFHNGVLLPNTEFGRL